MLPSQMIIANHKIKTESDCTTINILRVTRRALINAILFV